MSSSCSAPKQKLTSIAWKYFTIKDNNLKVAKCKICQKVLSYRTSTSNLMKHMKYLHKNLLREDNSDKSDIGDDTNLSVSETEGDDCNGDNDSEGNQAAKALESIETKNENDETVCILCEETFPDQDSTEMMEHMFKVHNISQIKLVDGNLHLEQEERRPQKIRAGRSCCWDYFTDKDNEAKVAVCNLCNGDFSYKSTVSNLVKHLKRKHDIIARRDPTTRASTDISEKINYKPHPLIWTFFNYVNEEKTVCACVHCNKKFNVADGQKFMKIHLLNQHPEVLMHHKTNSDPLFITTNETDNEEHDDDLPAEYLDFDDLNESDKVKRRPSVNVNSSFERRPSIECKPKRPKIYKSIENKPMAPGKIPDSLEYFTNYITSLLQELPEKISKKLQMNFVKQIIEAQLACDETEDSNDTVIRINRSVNGASAKGDGSVELRSVSGEAGANEEIVNSNGIIIRPIASMP